MRRASLTLLLILALSLAACSDTRREAVHSHLRAHPPEGFTLISGAESISLPAGTASSTEVIATVRLRRTTPTFETFDASTLPRVQSLEPALAELRAWALGTLPPDHPLRSDMLARIAAARSPQPVKRVVTPAGAEFDVLATLHLESTNGNWAVKSARYDLSVPGGSDPGASVPLESNPSVSARFDAAEALVRQLQAERTRYTETMRERARQDRSTLLNTLRPAHTFTGRMSDGRTVRAIVSRPPDPTGSGVIILTFLGGDETSVRYPGGFADLADGHVIWRSTEGSLLSATPGVASILGEFPSGITLSPDPSGLRLRFSGDNRPAADLTLQPTGALDLIPDLD